MSLFKKLPSEIEDKIWNLYWLDIFKVNVINHFNNIKEKIEDLKTNASFNKVLKFTRENKKLEYLNKYNSLILFLKRDKGSKKVSLILDKNLKYAFSDKSYSYLQYKELKPITNYILVKSGIMRYSAFQILND